MAWEHLRDAEKIAPELPGSLFVGVLAALRNFVLRPFE
jgi:hypothetical protein